MHCIALRYKDRVIQFNIGLIKSNTMRFNLAQRRAMQLYRPTFK